MNMPNASMSGMTKVFAIVIVAMNMPSDSVSGLIKIIKIIE